MATMGPSNTMFNSILNNLLNNQTSANYGNEKHPIGSILKDVLNDDEFDICIT